MRENKLVELSMAFSVDIICLDKDLPCRTWISDGEQTMS